MLHGPDFLIHVFMITHQVTDETVYWQNLNLVILVSSQQSIIGTHDACRKMPFLLLHMYTYTYLLKWQQNLPKESTLTFQFPGHLRMEESYMEYATVSAV